MREAKTFLKLTARDNLNAKKPRENMLVIADEQRDDSLKQNIQKCYGNLKYYKGGISDQWGKNSHDIV